MSTLPEVLNDPAKKPVVVNDCLTLIEQEVDDKSGFSGMAIKVGYKAVKGISPAFLRQAVEHLVPEFARALDPLYQEARSKAQPVSAYFPANSGRVADALLAITDGKAQKASGLVRKTYDGLRGNAKRNVEAAVPRLSRLIEKHAG